MAKSTKGTMSTKDMKEPIQEDQMPSRGMNEEGAGSEMPGSAMGESTAPARGESTTGEMPSGGMGDDTLTAGEMPGGSMESSSQPVLVELRVPSRQGESFALESAAALALSSTSFQLDLSYTPVPVGPPPGEAAAEFASADEQTVIVRGTIDPSKIPELEAQGNVVKVWKDGPIAPFGVMSVDEEPTNVVLTIEGFAACPIGTCDCTPGTAKGTIADVANYLGVDQIWASGRRGETIVVGVVDGGITAQGRAINSVDTSRLDWPNKLIPRVIGGWPAANWGTTGAAWDWHGNMCSTDVLGMAPNAQVYDIRISDGHFSLPRLQAFNGLLTSTG